MWFVNATNLYGYQCAQYTGSYGTQLDLGSANNGWLYNGSAAPQYISTGTTNTLTLTPVCGSVQQSVNVSVTANGNAYPANASVVSVTIPTFTIQGSQTLCSGTQSYSIPDLPCNATVSWQSSNTNIATITASGNPATLTRVNNSNGVVTITATINTCGSNQVVPYQVGVGKAQPGTVNILLFDPYMGKIPAEIDPVPGATSYKWYKNGVVQPGRVGTFANIGISETPCNINYNIAVEAVSSCGTSAASSANVFYSCDYLFTISPNPAQSMVSVSVKETKKIQDGSGVIDEIRIYDSYGGLQKRLQHFGTKRADFNISGIPSGRYLIEIRSGKYKEYQQLIIQK